jgi:serine/threonine protein phosphatase PrpC
MQHERIAAVAVSDTGRVRGHNEDVASISEFQVGGAHYQVWLVADGMGGGIRGDEASAKARDQMLATLASDASANKASDDPVAALLDGIERANAAVFDLGSEGGTLSFSRMGTTLVAALVETATGRHWIVNVGDSRAYLLREGAATQLTTDHSLVAEAAEAGLITAEEARRSHRKNVITRAIGIERDVEPEILGPLELSRDERLLLCSDGLHGMIDDVAIGRLAAEGALADVANRLMQAANEAGGRDNITVLIGGREAVGSTELQPDSSADESRSSVKGDRRFVRWTVAGLALAIGLAAAATAIVVLAT